MNLITPNNSSKIRSQWQNGKPVLNAWISAPLPFHAEIAASCGFDSVCMDMQHGLIDLNHLPEMLMAASHKGAAAVCRLAHLDPISVMKALDYGSEALICPMINTQEQAEQFVRLSSYPPQGVRSFGPIRASLAYGENYKHCANEFIIRFAMIETKEAVLNAQAIMQTPGIDAVYIGPADLALSHGFPPKLDHEEEPLQNLIKSILNTAKKQNKRAGIHCASPQYAKRMLDLGFDLVTLCSDIGLVRDGFSAALGQLR